jgi:hypothetical protein
MEFMGITLYRLIFSLAQLLPFLKMLFHALRWVECIPYMLNQFLPCVNGVVESILFSQKNSHQHYIEVDISRKTQ